MRNEERHLDVGDTPPSWKKTELVPSVYRNEPPTVTRIPHSPSLPRRKKKKNLVSPQQTRSPSDLDLVIYDPYVWTCSESKFLECHGTPSSVYMSHKIVHPCSTCPVEIPMGGSTLTCHPLVFERTPTTDLLRTFHLPQPYSHISHSSVTSICLDVLVLVPPTSSYQVLESPFCTSRTPPRGEVQQRQLL